MISSAECKHSAPAECRRENGTQQTGRGSGGADALEGKWPQRWPQKRSDRRLEEVAKAVGGGYCRLQMPLKLALAVRRTVAGHRLGALERGGGGAPPLPMHPCRGVQMLLLGNDTCNRNPGQPNGKDWR